MTKQLTLGVIIGNRDFFPVCRNGFEHHVVMNASKTAAILKEAFENYMGWEVYEHG